MTDDTNDNTPNLPTRRPFQGAGQILQYNTPFYAVGALVVLAGAWLLRVLPLPAWLVFWGWASVLLAAWWLLASLVASWWVYDASPLFRFAWIPGVFHVPPRRWANLHAGLDEFTPALRTLFPGTSGLVLDFFDPETMTEPSISRARELSVPPEPPISVHANALPVGDNSLDAVFLFFAAHELRQQSDREGLFLEIARTLAPGGRLVLAEHGRDLANFVAFGPGFLHFWPREEWPRLANLTNLTTVETREITPFVGVWVFEKGERMRPSPPGPLSQ